MLKLKSRIDDPTTLSPSGDTLFPAHKVLINYEKGTTKPINYVVVVLVKDVQEENSTCCDMLVLLPYTKKIREKYDRILQALRESPVAIATVSFSFNRITRCKQIITDDYSRTYFYASAYNVELIN